MADAPPNPLPGSLLVPKNPGLALRELMREEARDEAASDAAAEEGPTDPQSHRPTKPQGNKRTRQQTHKDASPQTNKATKAQGDVDTGQHWYMGIAEAAKQLGEGEGRQARLSMDLDEDLHFWLKSHSLKHRLKMRQLVTAVLVAYREAVENSGEPNE